MKKFKSEENEKNNINSIGQYYIMQYLKRNLDIEKFDIYIIDKNNVKVIDQQNEKMYFHYNEDTREVTYQTKPFSKEKER